MYRAYMTMNPKGLLYGLFAVVMCLSISRQIDEEQENTPPAATLMYYAYMSC